MNTEIQLMLQQAIKAFESGNFDDADLKLKSVLRVDAKNFIALYIIGLIKASQSKYGEAADYLARAAQTQPNDASLQYNLAKALADSGNDKDALTHHKKAVALDPNNPGAWINYGLSTSNLGHYDEAIAHFERALGLKPDYAEAWSNKGTALYGFKRYDEAIAHFDKALSLKPDYAEAWSNKGNALNKLKRYIEAIAHYEQALSLKPNYAEAWFNKAATLHELKRYDEAIAHYDQVLSLRPDYVKAWFNKAATLHELKRYDEAIAHYDQALGLKPDYAEAWSNKGATLHELKRYVEAITHYDQALSLKSDFAEVWSNKGNALNKLKRSVEAITHYDKALSLQPDYAEAWSNKGATLHELKRYHEAIVNYNSALSLRLDIDWVSGNLLHTKMKICSWSGLAESLIDISEKVMANKKVINPFQLLPLNDDSFLHKKSSEIFTQDKYSFNPLLGSIPKYSKRHKIRIGYFSADFRNHAVSALTAELFELHDKSKFEIIAFSFGIRDKSALHLRISRAFNQFIDVNGMSDLDVAKLSRELRIDVAVDLGGHTAGARTNIFAYRAAPIQVSYLGYLGTMGAEYMDYICADITLIPESLQKFYTEKIVYLPSYQVNDRKRHISEKKFTRAELSLPETGFIFCCFNNNYKILPATFDGWMRILKAVDGSTLFLYAENEWVEQNLKKEAKARGVDDGRLVFGKKMPSDEYLARYQACDLFLDTFPYNAGTTASDALWSELPIVTLMGKSFASRMAASILNAIGLPELITSTQEEYEALAIELALNPKKLADIKLKLANNRSITHLFNTPLFTKKIEAAYVKMYDHYQNNLQPEHLFIT